MSLLLSRIKKVRIKNEGARVATTLNIDFSKRSRADNSAVKGRIRLKFEPIRDIIVVSSEMLWPSLLLPSMKKIRSKWKALEWPQHKIMIFQTLKGS